MKYSRADIEIFIKLILQVESEEGFSLCREHALVLERDADVLSRIDNALIGDCDYAHCIVDGIVGIFGELYASGHDNDRAAGHIHGVESDLRTCRSLIFARKNEFVLVGILTRYDKCGVVKFLIDIFLRDNRVSYHRGQMRAERFDDRKYKFAGGRIDSVAVDEIEEAVGIALFVGVNAVKVHHLKERLVVEPCHREIIDLRAGGIGEIFDVQLEFRFLYLISSERVYVLHHQMPHRQLGRCGGALKHFHV